MKLRDFKIGWRLLIKEPSFSALVIFGLSFAFAACFLLLGYVRYSLSYEAHVEEPESIYVVKHRLNIISRPEWYDLTPMPFKKAADSSGLALTSSAVFPLALSARIGTQVSPLELKAVDSTFPAMFGVKTLEGDLTTALSKPEAVALTVKTAQRLFGTSQVLGKTLLIEGASFTVAALIQDTPSNTTLNYEALVGTNTAAVPSADRDQIMNAWGGISGKVYLKLGKNTNPDEVQKILQTAGDNSPFAMRLPPEARQKLGNKKLFDIKLGNFKQAYFDDDLANSGGAVHGDKKTIFGLAAVAILILILATINYVNLAVVRTLRRQREIGMYKMLGASHARIVGQFLAESILVALIATAFGLLLMWLFLPVFSDLVNRQLDNLFTPSTLLFSLALGIFVGICAGAYPTWVALNVRANQALAGRGNFESRGGLWLRRVLTVLQFSTAMGLASLTLAITWQTQYSSQLNLGFIPDPLIVVELATPMSDPNTKNFRDALLRSPEIKSAAGSSNAVGQDFIGFNATAKRDNGASLSMNVQDVTNDFFEAHQIKALAGRMYDSKLDAQEDTNIAVINEAAARAFGFATAQAATGQTISMELRRNQVQALKIIGVSPNLRYQSAREKEQPRMYLLSPRQAVITVQAKSDVAKTEQQITQIWKSYFPNNVLTMRRSTSLVEQNYADDIRLAKLLSAATVLAVIIAAFGIYVLAAYSVRRQVKEIALRKLYGARGKAIAILVGKEFLGLIGISALIGLSLGALSISHYLASFVEQAPIGIWTLLASLVFALVIAFFSTLRHTLSALRIAPAIVLRS
jgi:putative ABC transport system permease protein